MTLKIPAIVIKILQELKNSGFEGYVVGGCARDILLNRAPDDWDITTNAKPEEIQGIFSHENIWWHEAIYENQFGTVGIITNAANSLLKLIEATTYRLEGKYTDKRHPDEIKFAKTLEEDLSRRDFTINTLALDLKLDNILLSDSDLDNVIEVDYDLIDLFNGAEDLKNGIIRAVGDPEKRFSEDALRLMRAVRFATQLSFLIEEKTLESLRKLASNLQYVSGERIRDELIKMIMTPNAADGIRLLSNLGLLDYIIPELKDTIDVSQNKHHIYSVWEHLWRSLEYSAKEDYSLEVRLASLFHDIGKPGTKQGNGVDATFLNHEMLSAKITKKILTRLHFPNYILDKVLLLVRYHMFFYEPETNTDASLRRLLVKVGRENIEDLAKVREADRIGSGCPKALPFKLRHFLFKVEKVLKELDGENPGLKMLKIDGDNLIKEVGMEPGPKLGFVLSILLEEVLEDISKNTKEYLLEKAKELNSKEIQELKEMSLKAEETYSKVLNDEEQEIKDKYYV